MVNVQFRGIKYIHKVASPSPPSISKSCSSPQTLCNHESITPYSLLPGNSLGAQRWPPPQQHPWSLANYVPAKPAEEQRSPAHCPSLEPVQLRGSIKVWGTCDPSCHVPTEIPPREAELPALTPRARVRGSPRRAPHTEVPPAWQLQPRFATAALRGGAPLLQS